MSRRKQSNPKPIKRPEDEIEENHVTEKMDQSDIKEIDSNQSEERFFQDFTTNEPMETNNIDCVKDITPPTKIKVESTGESKLMQDDGIDSKPNVIINGQMSQREQEVMKRLCFPSDLLTLRQVEEAEFLQTGILWSIITLIPVPNGSTIGSYQGEYVALSSIKPGELVLQFQDGDGDLSFVKVTEEIGAWLSLLRPADHKASHNVCVYFEGGRIWCEIVQDLNKGTELLASFITNPNELPGLNGNKLCSDNTDIASKEVKGFVQAAAAIKRQEPKSVSQIPTQPALIYGCPFCDIKFSSRRTLEAHLTYYCCKKPQDFVSLQQCMQQQAQSMLDKPSLLHGVTENVDASSPTLKVDQTPPKCLKRISECTTSSLDNEQSDTDTPKTKSPKTGESYKCTKLDYIVDGSSSGVLHKHLLTSKSDSSSYDGERLFVSPVCQEEMFCKECRIQFSSVSTYRGHKELYCSFRPTGGQENTSELVTLATKGVKNDLTMKQLSSPTDTEGTKSLSVQGHFNASLVSLSPYLILPPPFDLLSKSQQQGEIRKVKVTSATNGSLPSSENVLEHAADDQPLDLSKSKSSTEDDKDKIINSKHLLSNYSISVKSEPGIQSELLNLPAKKTKLSARSPDTSLSVSKTTLTIPSVLPTVSLGNQIPYVSKKPVSPLQSVSRCAACNIVFYKHENYLIHKEHYCSGKQTIKDSASSDLDHVENDEKEIEQVQKPKPEAVAAHNENPESVAIKQTMPDTAEIVDQSKISLAVSELAFRYCCIPCKIKFSSASTLKAHKNFYCPHGKENEIISISDSDDKSENESSSENTFYHCDHCGNEFSSARLLKLHICLNVSMTPLLRCLYCEYVTQRENRLSEHVKVHVPTKAFKCNLCGYRGNTARGMRMHGKMHLESGEEFTDENMIELEEPPMVPIQRNGMCEKGPVDMETELIRMKNEPYKRRRSRKSFEKSENRVPFLGQSCAACGQKFGNVSDFVIHLRMHEIAALEAMKRLKSLMCEHCNIFVADSLTALLIHMQANHPEQLPGNSKSDLDQGLSESERSTSCDSQVSVNRSRSISSDGSKTCHSDSSHDNSNDATCEVTPKLPQDHDLENFKCNPKMSKACEIDDDNKNTKHSFKDINKHSTEEERLFEINDLELRKVKSRHHDQTSSVTEDSRSNKAEKQTLLSGSPNHNVSPQSHQLSPKKEPACSPPQQPSPILHVKFEPKSHQLAKEQSHCSPVRSKSISPVDEFVRQTDTKLDKFSPKIRSPDLKTRFLLNQNSPNIKLECLSPPQPDTPKMSSPLSGKIPITIPKIPISIGALSPRLHNFPLLFSPHALLSPYQFSHEISFLPSHQTQDSPPSVLSVSEKNGRKYCKHCDINFTYLSSFLTHKRYYCSARNSEEMENPTASA